MVANRCEVHIPDAMWASMRESLEASMGTDLNEQRLFKDEGVFVELMLMDGMVKSVLVRADACITAERYEEWGVRAEKYGPPRFAAEDIKSWGYYEQVRQLSWRHPFKKAKVWKVRVWSDGRLNRLEMP